MLFYQTKSFTFYSVQTTYWPYIHGGWSHIDTTNPKPVEGARDSQCLRQLIHQDGENASNRFYNMLDTYAVQSQLGAWYAIFRVTQCYNYVTRM